MRAHVIAIGVNKYRTANALRFAVSDAERFAGAITSAVQHVDVEMHADPNAQLSWREGREILKDLSTRGYGARDSLIFYFAGHGYFRDGLDNLLFSDSNPSDPATTISTKEILEAIQASSAGLSALVMDACRVPSGVRGMVDEEFGVGTRELSNTLGLVSIFGCSPNEMSQESQNLDSGAGVFTAALAEFIKERKSFVPYEISESLPGRVLDSTQALELSRQTPIVSCTNLRLMTRDILSGSVVKLAKRDSRMLVLVGLPNAGKTTLGVEVASRLGYTHAEMSRYAYAQFNVASDRDGFEGNMQDYMQRVLWREGDYGRIARDLLRANPDVDQLVVTGPRKHEEIDVLRDAGFHVELLYLYADSRTRYQRMVHNSAQGDPDFFGMSLTGFVKRDLVENAWGLPKIGLIPHCKIIHNEEGKRDLALRQVLERVKWRGWFDGDCA